MIINDVNDRDNEIIIIRNKKTNYDNSSLFNFVLNGLIVDL